MLFHFWKNFCVLFKQNRRNKYQNRQFLSIELYVIVFFVEYNSPPKKICRLLSTRISQSKIRLLSTQSRSSKRPKKPGLQSPDYKPAEAPKQPNLPHFNLLFFEKGKGFFCIPPNPSRIDACKPRNRRQRSHR